MKIEVVKVGFLRTNCYLLEKDHSLLVIDPGDEIEKIKQAIGNRSVLGVLVTHHHSDHVGAISYFKEKPIYEFPNLEEKTYQVGPFSFQVLFTKGHTSDSVTFYFEEEQVMFTGDFLFHEDVGRTDLPTGNQEDMIESIRKIKKYDPGIRVYPGHEEATTLEHEFIYNEVVVLERL